MYLIEALVHRRLAGAGLDVFPNEPHISEALSALDNAVLQPHTGSGAHATRHAMGRQVEPEVSSSSSTSITSVQLALARR